MIEVIFWILTAPIFIALGLVIIGMALVATAMCFAISFGIIAIFFQLMGQEYIAEKCIQIGDKIANALPGDIRTGL